MKIFKKILIVFFALVALFLVTDAGLVWGMAHWHPKIEHADSIIVLGAAINTPALVNRTEKALELYQAGKADQIVFSGGKIADPDISEAKFMEKVIKKNTNEKVNYILEDQSHNTYENIKNSRDKVQNSDSVIIVSDAFHLARAVVMAKSVGFKKVYWAAPSTGYYSHKELRYYYFREFVAMINYIPKFLKG